MLGDIIEGRTYEYQLILCKPDKVTQLGVLDITDLTYSPRFNSYSQLDFVLNYYENGWTKIKNKTFDIINGEYLILMRILDNEQEIYKEYFIIEEISNTGDNGSYKKNITCYSEEYSIFNNKKITSYNDVRKLYDGNLYNFENNQIGGILDYVLQYKLQNTWTVGYINPSLLNVYHTFDISEMTLTELFNTLQDTYMCFILFDNVNQQINIYTYDEVGEDSGIILNQENYIKNINYQPKFNEIKTRITFYGKNRVTFNEYDIRGQSYLDNFSYYKNNGFWSDSLQQAYSAYEALLESKRGEFSTLLTQLNNATDSLQNKKNELEILNLELELIEQQMDLEQKNSNYTTYNYTELYYQKLDKESEISNKKNEIASIENQIQTIKNNMVILNAQLSYENNFTVEQLKELNKYIKEDVVTIDTVEDMSLLYEYAQKYIVKKAELPIEFSIDLIDIFSCEDCQLDWKKLQKCGDYIWIDYPEFNINHQKIRLCGYSHNPFKKSLSLEFSNQDKIDNELQQLKDILARSSQTSTTVINERDSYKQYLQDKLNILTTESTITNNISVGNGITITQRGFIGSDIGGSGAIKLLEDRLIISSDGWQTYHTLLSGRGIYLENDKNRVLMMPEHPFQLDQKIYNSSTGNYDYNNIVYLNTEGKLYLKDIVIVGGSIIWNSVNTPTAEQIGARPDNWLPTLEEIGAIAKNQDEVFNILTNNGTLRGLFMENNELYINADYIRGNVITGVAFRTGEWGQERIEITTSGSLIKYKSDNTISYSLDDFATQYWVTQNFAGKDSLDMAGWYIDYIPSEKHINLLNAEGIVISTASLSNLVKSSELSFQLSKYALQDNLDQVSNRVNDLVGWSLFYDSTTKQLSLKNAVGNTISTVTIN